VNALLSESQMEKKLATHGFQKKFVLEMKSQGDTRLTLRLTKESVRQWIDKMEYLLANETTEKIVLS
jgi:hypothetical protein